VGKVFDRGAGLSADIDDEFIKIFSLYVIPDREFSNPAESVYTEFSLLFLRAILHGMFYLLAKFSQ
jgi:hypothetical protein